MAPDAAYCRICRDTHREQICIDAKNSAQTRRRLLELSDNSKCNDPRNVGMISERLFVGSERLLSYCRKLALNYAQLFSRHILARQSRARHRWCDVCHAVADGPVC